MCQYFSFQKRTENHKPSLPNKGVALEKNVKSNKSMFLKSDILKNERI